MSLALGWTFDNTLTDYVTGLEPSFVTTGAYAAAGGTITSVGGNRIHTFTTVGEDSITFRSPGNIQLLVVAGGGGGGANNNSAGSGGGGGAGEVAYYSSYPVNSGTYTVVVGKGGLGGQWPSPGDSNAGDGFASSFGTLSANGGGGGSTAEKVNDGFSGGSGGGAGRNTAATSLGGASVVTAGGIGNKGGDCTDATNMSAGGGGGATSAGTTGYASGIVPVAGGSGYVSTISGASVTYGTGGDGGARSNTTSVNSTTPNLGNGGDGAHGGGTAGLNGRNGAAGGSGIVIVSYSTASFAPTFVSGEYRNAIYFENSISTGTTIPKSNVYYTVSLNSITGYTIAFWVNFYVGSIFAQSPLEVSLAGGGRAVNIYIDSTNILTSYDGTINIRSSPAVSIGTWNHVALVIQGTTRVLYLNGVGFSGTSGLTGTQSGFILGGGLTNYSAWCSIDDLRVYKGALNATQVQELYTLNGTPAPVASLNLTNYSASAGIAYGGTTLLTQVSPANAVVGYSLRAISAPTALVANVAVQIALPSFTSAVTVGSLTYTQTLTSSFPYGGSGTYVARSSSVYSTTTRAWQAFDDNTSTWWETIANQYTGTPGTVYGGTVTTTVGGTAYPGEWIDIQLPEPMALDKYSMYARSSAFDYRMPYNWIIAGSNNGTTWTQVTSRSSQGSWRGQEPIEYSVNSTTPYLYFRMIVTAIVDGSGAQNVNLGQWTIYASSSTWSRDVSADIYGNLTTSTGQELSSYLGSARGLVATWYDQSGAGNNASQGTRSNQPNIQKSSKGPGWSVVCANDSLIGMSYTVLNNTNYSFSVVERRNYESTTGMYLISSGNNTANQGLHFGYVTPGTIVRFGQYQNDIDINPYPGYSYTDEPMHYWLGTQSSTSGRFLYEKGIVTVSDATKTTLLSSTSGNFQVSKYLASTTQGFSGEIYEVIVWKRALTITEAKQVYNNQYGYINGNPGSIIFS